MRPLLQDRGCPMYYSGRSSEQTPFRHEKGVRNWSWPLTETFHCMYSHDTYSCIVWYTWGILFNFRNLIFITCSYTTVESHFLKCLTLYNKNQNWLPFPSRILSVMGFLSDEIIQIKFVKLWDFSRYSKKKTPKRPTYQKLASQGKLSLRYLPSYGLMTPCKFF